MLCRERSLVNENSSGGIAIPLMCRSWGCDYCAPRRQRDLIALATRGDPNRLVTLTISPTVGAGPADRAARIARAWRLVAARWRRKYPASKLEYLAVFEATKRGEPHLHILCRSGFIPQRWLSDQMRGIVNSPICDVRAVNNGRQAARYIAKYIGKEPHHFATCKRYWHTRGYEVVDASASPETTAWGSAWLVDERPLAEILRDWTRERKNPQPYRPWALSPSEAASLDIVAWGRFAQPPANAAGLASMVAQVRP